MAEFPAFPLWTDAYLSDTGHLTTLEHGAYLLLLLTMWRAGGSLPNDDKRLARFCRLTPGQWQRIKPTIMEFFRVNDGVITQGRLSDELSFVKRKRKSQSQKAKSRWLKTNDSPDAVASAGQCRGDAPTPTPTPTVRKKPPKPPSGAGEIDLFEEWYEGFPRKVAKGAARKAFARAQKKASQADLIEGAKRYAAKVLGKEQHFIAHPATWLNDERWLDSDAPPGAVANGVSLEKRVAVARDWLSRNDDIPTWMDSRETADALIKEGFDYDRLRKAGFGLPPRGNVVDITGVAKVQKIGGDPVR